MKYPCLLKTGLLEPAQHLFFRVVELITRGVPVKIVTTADPEVGMCREAEELAENRPKPRDPPQDGPPESETAKGWIPEAGRDGPGRRVQGLLEGPISSVKPDGHLPTLPQEGGECPKGLAGVRRMVEDADGEDAVKEVWAEGVSDKVSLNHVDLRQSPADLPRLLDRRTSVDSQYLSPEFRRLDGIAPAPATGVEDEGASKPLRVKSGFREEGRPVLIGSLHLVPLPLDPKALRVAFEIFVQEPGDRAQDGIARPTDPARQNSSLDLPTVLLLDLWREKGIMAAGTNQPIQNFLFHAIARRWDGRSG